MCTVKFLLGPSACLPHREKRRFAAEPAIAPAYPLFDKTAARALEFPARTLTESDRVRRTEAATVAISDDLLEILVCPACKAKVELKADGSGLKCVSCHRVYPVRDDIPVMLVDEATVEEDGERA
jgi:uncharacterized protein YbaR (Trm112 family)